jgi:plasmid stabilization system protein ParE
MEIRWSVPAAEDLERICAFIERDNPEADIRLANKAAVCLDAENFHFRRCPMLRFIR